jgi:two-component system NarL family sensor kinase
MSRTTIFNSINTKCNIVFLKNQWIQSFFTLIFLCTSTIVSFSQKADVTHVKQLNDSAQYYFEISNFDKALKFVTLAKSQAEDKKLSEELAKSYYIMGNIVYRNGHFRESQMWQQKCLALAGQIENTSLQRKALSNLGSILSQLGEYDSAENFIMQSIQSETDKRIIMMGFGRLGSNYKRQQQYASAINFHVKSLAIAQEIKDSLASAKTLANIGNIYFEQNEKMRALEYYNEALALLDSSRHGLSLSGISLLASDAYLATGQLNKAEAIITNAMRIIKKLKLSGSEPYAFRCLADLKAKQGKTKEAIPYYNKALFLLKPLDSWSENEFILIQLGEAYIKLHEYEKAKAALNEGKLISEKYKHALGLQNIYQLLSRMDSMQGNFKSSLAHYKKFEFYKDTIFTVKKATAIEELNKKFAYQQKEKIIQEQKVIIEQQQTKEIFFTILIIVFFSVIAIISFFISRRQKLKLQIEQEQQRKQNLLTIVVAQEQTQQKIARDLHDSLVQVLGAAKISLESIKGDYEGAASSKKIQETADIIDQACVEARTISHQLLPYSLQKHGLILSLEELFEKTLKKSVETFEFNHSGIQSRFRDTIEINVYRIVQELINNITKHASAAKMQVQLTQRNDRLTLWICDDGKGFNPKTISHGAGLMNIESRLQLIQGTMSIESEIGKGTTTLINIPLH